MTVQADNAAYICGDQGYIRIPVPWKPPTANAEFVIEQQRSRPKQDITAQSNADATGPRTITVDSPGHLYGEEADRFAATVLDGIPPFMSREDTLSNARVLETLRRRIGFN